MAKERVVFFGVSGLICFFSNPGNAEDAHYNRISNWRRQPTPKVRASEYDPGVDRYRLEIDIATAVWRKFYKQVSGGRPPK